MRVVTGRASVAAGLAAAAGLAPVAGPAAVAGLAVALILSSTLASTALAQEDPAARAHAEQAIRQVEAALEKRPNDGVLQYYMAMFNAQAGHRDRAIEWLRRVAQRRMGFHPTPGSGFDSLWGDEEFQKVLGEIAANETRVDDAREAFRLPDAKFVPEGIDYDPKGKRHFIGSVTQRRILQRSRNGTFADFSRTTDGLKSVLGVRVDAPRGLLYAVSTNSFARATNEGVDNALFVYDLKTAALRARLRVPEAVSLNDVAVGPRGEVAVSDSGAGTIYVLDPAPGPIGELIFLVPPRRLSSSNGLVFAPDGTRLFVATATGIVAVDVASGEFQRLAQPDDIATGAIDGLYVHDGDLIGVQNVICPGRVVRLDIDEEGRAIRGLTVLQAYHQALDEPTTGTIVGKSLHVIANSSVARVAPDGSLRDEATLEPASILAVPLSRP